MGTVGGCRGLCAGSRTRVERERPRRRPIQGTFVSSKTSLAATNGGDSCGCANATRSHSNATVTRLPVGNRRSSTQATRIGVSSLYECSNDDIDAGDIRMHLHVAVTFIERSPVSSGHRYGSWVERSGRPRTDPWTCFPLVLSLA